MNLSKSEMETLDEIEKIFGEPTKMSLYADEEIAYNVFRQSIINAPFCTYDKTKLPFAEIKEVCFQPGIKESVYVVGEMSKLLYEKIINPLLVCAKLKSEGEKAKSDEHIFG